MQNEVLPIYMKEIFYDLSVMELDRQGRPKTNQNIRDMINKFANDAMPSLKPNPTGFGVKMNPTPTLSREIFEESSRYMDKIFDKYADSETHKKKLVKEYKRLVMSLTSLYMGMVLGVPRARKQKGKATPTLDIASPFEFVKKQGKTGTPEEIEHNKKVEIMRYYRMLVEASITSALKPIFEMKPDEVIYLMINVLKMNQQTSAKLRSQKTRKSFVKQVVGALGEKFDKINIIKTLLKS